MDWKKFMLGAAIVAVSFFLLFQVLRVQRTSGVIVDESREFLPNRFYYTEFTIEEPCKLRISITAEDENANISWYVCSCDKNTFVSVVTGQTPYTLSDITYKSGLEVGSRVETTITIESKGVYTFAVIQTNQNVQSRRMHVLAEIVRR